MYISEDSTVLKNNAFHSYRQILAGTALRLGGGASESAAPRIALIRLLTTDIRNKGAVAPSPLL